VAAVPREVLEDLSRHPAALIYLVAIFGYSESLAETILADPGLVIQFARDRHLTKLKSTEDLMQDYARYSVTSPDLWLSSQLARFKRRNVLRIALKDVLGLSSLGETTLELATLADVILKHSLAYCDRELEKRYGLPQYRDAQGRIARSGFSTMSLGKLGGNELNYSSDIDLIFLYARDGETAGGSEPSSVISNKEYYVRLSEAVNRTITQSTPHGEVYRVDLGKRPEGELGGLAISVNSALEYYDHRARDWELQMLIKARHSAGDARVSREFLQGVEPYVYRSSGGARGAGSRVDEREKSADERKAGAEPGLDVKFHPGGLRDVELLTQTLQRIHGADDFWVRSGGTLLALRKLHDKGHLSDSDFARLTSAYEFFRKVEHRIQLEADTHPHRLPAGRDSLERLARRVSTEMGATHDAGAALVARLRQTFFVVQEINRRLIQARPAAVPSTDFGLGQAVAAPPDSAHDHFQVALRLLGTRAPELAALAREASLGVRARNDAAKLLSAMQGSSENLGAVRRNPTILKGALEITAASPYLAQRIIQRPEDLLLLDSMRAEDLARSPAQMTIGIQESLPDGNSPAGLSGRSVRLNHVPPFPWATDSALSLSGKMAMLRTEFRTRTLLQGARDCVQLGSVAAALGRWSRLAARCISSAVEIAAWSLGNTYRPGRSGFVVLGLGSLGRNEFDLGSAAELVFVALGPSSAEQFKSSLRLAERIVEALSSYTREGDVFPLDLPVQPGGAPVVTGEGLMEFVARAAPLAQAFRVASACPIAGDVEYGRQLLDRLGTLLSTRLNSRLNPEEDLRPLFQKDAFQDCTSAPQSQRPGGESADVELAVGLFSLRHHLPFPAGTDVPSRIAVLHEHGLVSAADAGDLVLDMEFLLSVDHAIRLVTGSVEGELPGNSAGFEEVESLIRRWDLISPKDMLAPLHSATRRRVYALCLRLAGLAPGEAAKFTGSRRQKQKFTY
jgi:glutamate-ammonia-ligase adenylyltransferase